MSIGRPAAPILLEVIDRKTYNAIQILDTRDSLYAVYHNGQPFNYRTLNKLLNEQNVRYKKVCFPTIGQARRLAFKLNQTFKTSLFEVYKLTGGEKIDAKP